MRPFKRYVTCFMAFLIPFTRVTLCQFHSTTSTVLLKITNYRMRKNIFCIYGCFSESRYFKGGRKSYLQTRSQPILTTYWMISSCCLSLYYEGLMRNQEGTIELRICCFFCLLPFFHLLQFFITKFFFAIENEEGAEAPACQCLQSIIYVIWSTIFCIIDL